MKQAIKSRAEIYAGPETDNVGAVRKLFVLGERRIISLVVSVLISLLMSMPIHARVVPGQNLWQEIAQVAVEFDNIEEEVKDLAYITSLIDLLQTGTTVSASLADDLLDGTCEVGEALEDISGELEVIACKMEALESVADQAAQELQDIENLLESDLDIFDGIADELPDTQAGLEGVLEGLGGLESGLDNLDNTLQDTQSQLELIESIFDEIEQDLELVEQAALGVQDFVEDIQSTLESVESTMDLVAQEAKSIQSLADSIEGTVDNTASTLETIEAVVAVIDQEVQNISSTLDTIDANLQEALDLAENIENIFETVASDLDAIADTALDVEGVLKDSINSIESSLDTIESVIDTLEDIESVVDITISQVESLDSASDVAVSITDSNESVVCIISSVIENIESVTEVIESKVDVESSILDLIESNVDILLAQSCTYLIYQADVDAGGGTYTITQPGTYCLAESIFGTIAINSNCVVLDLHNYVIRPVGSTDGVSVVGVEHVVIKNGWIKGGEAGGLDGVFIQNSSDILVKDLRIVMMTQSGVFIGSSHCITVEQCIIDTIQGFGVYLQICEECTVKDCIIRQVVQGITLTQTLNNCLLNCVFLSCAISYNDLDGENNLCMSCLVEDTSQGFSIATQGVVRDSIVLNGLSLSFPAVGFVLHAVNAVADNGIVLNMNKNGIQIGSGEGMGAVGNYVSGEGVSGSLGIGTSFADRPKVFNNLVQNFDMNYSAVDLATIEFAPDETTRFWANISRAQAAAQP